MHDIVLFLLILLLRDGFVLWCCPYEERRYAYLLNDEILPAGLTI